MVSGTTRKVLDDAVHDVDLKTVQVRADLKALGTGVFREGSLLGSVPAITT